MKRIEIDAALFTSREETHRVLKKALDFPDYDGCNLDALHDCLTDIAEDTEIVLLDDGAFRKRLGNFADGLIRVFRESAEENPMLSFSVKVGKKRKDRYLSE